MKNDEDTLLTRRVDKSDRLLKLSIASLIVMFLASIVLIAVHYRLLMVELGKREESETSARHLSAQLLRLQDEERRKFSRELHDGLGQTLAVLKWTLSSVLEKNPEDPAIAESVKSVDEAILAFSLDFIDKAFECLDHLRPGQDRAFHPVLNLLHAPLFLIAPRRPGTRYLP